MIAACDGGTFCTIGQGASLANITEHLTPLAAQAVNLYLSVGA